MNSEKKIKKIPITLIVGVSVILLAAIIVFFVGFYPNIKVKKAFAEKIETIGTREIVHVTVEDPDAPSGIFENAGFSTVISDSRREIIKNMFLEAFGKVKLSDRAENSMIGDHDYHLRFRIDDETKFDFYLKDGVIYTVSGNFRDSFAPTDAEAYEALVNYLGGLIEEEGGGL